METLVLRPGLAEAIIDHAREGYPEEVCGLIAGKAGQGSRIYRGRNVAAAPRTRFELDAATLARQVDFEDEGLELAAIYHSHPLGPEVPSATDISQAFYPEAVYIVCSLERADAPALRAFRIRDGQTWEVGLRPALDNYGTIDDSYTIEVGP